MPAPTTIYGECDCCGQITHVTLIRFMITGFVTGPQSITDITLQRLGDEYVWLCNGGDCAALEDGETHGAGPDGRGCQDDTSAARDGHQAD